MPPHGVVLIAHGLGGHGGQFENAAVRWVEENWSVYALDFRGHGHSEGTQGYVNQWEEYRQDLAALLQQAKQDYPEKPMILWGHSLGGLIALDFALQHPTQLSGLMVTAPAVGKTGISPWKFVFGVVLSWLWPRFSLALGFDPNACSRDPAQVRDYNADPLRHQRGTARLSTEFQKAQKRIMAHLSALNIPILILHGESDRITRPHDSITLYESLTDHDRQLIQYPGAYHELHLEVNHKEVLTDMLQWMQSKVMPLDPHFRG